MGMKGRPKRRNLTREQLDYAGWLALAPWERVPSTLKEKAKDLGVSDRTLMTWQKLPEVIQAVNEAWADTLASLVGEATAVLKKALKEPNSVTRVDFDAARYIVKDWSKKADMQGDVVRSIVEFYKKYNANDVVESE